MARVRITKTPKALSGLEVKMQDMKPGLYGTNGNRQFSLPNQIQSSRFSEPNVEVRGTLQPVDREDANLEAERGETAIVNMGGMPAHFKIGGKRHSEGGTPLNLPDNSFIYSDTSKMKIKDLVIQAQFGMVPKKSGYTPAEISKKYDINKFRKVLADKNSEPVERKTAEMMISNYNLKLAKLALIQESMKGFPQGIPLVAMPYIIENEMDAAQFLPDQAQEQLEGAEQPDADTGEARYGANVISKWDTHEYGGIPKAQKGFAVPRDNKVHDITQLKKEALAKKVAPNWDNVSKRPDEYALWKDPNYKGEKEYVRKGFSGNKRSEDVFAKDPETKTAYDAYRAAMLMKDSDPAKAATLMATKTALNEKDVSGLGWTRYLGNENNQTKVSQMMDILDEEYLRLADPKAYSEKYKKEPTWKTEQKLDELSRKKVKDLYNTASFMKRSSKDPLQVLQLEEDLKKLEDLHPDYRKNNPSEVDETGASWIYYNPKESAVISDLATKYPTLESAAESYKTKKIKKPSVDTYFPSDEEVAKMRPEEAAKWDVIWEKTHPSYKKKLGGSLDKYQEGRETFAEKQARLASGKKSTTTSGTTSGTKGGKTASTDPMIFDEGKVQVPYKMQEAYTATGVKNLNKYLVEYGMDPLPENASKEQIKAAAGQLQQLAIEKNPTLVEHYMKERNPKPNAKLEQMLVSKGYGKTNADLKKAVAEGKISSEEIRNAYKDDQWWFRALTTEKKRLPREEYEKKMKQQGAIKQGDKTFFGDDPTRPYVYTEYEPIDPEKKATATLPEKEKDPVRDPFQRNPPMGYKPKAYAPWWLQDIVKTSGAAADLARVKRYDPWQDTPQVFLPKATYYDPTRELAANTEQANLASQFHQAFTGPKSGAISGIQGKALDNAANIMAKYNNLNVGLANQLSQERASILNTASQNKAGLNTQLWDKYTIANQQFDNSKNMARQNLRQSYMDAITNRAKTQALNTLYPNFYTDPSMGGFVDNTGYASINPTKPGSTEADQVQTLIERFPGMDPTKAFDIIRKNKSTDEDGFNAQEYRKAQGYT